MYTVTPAQANQISACVTIAVGMLQCIYLVYMYMYMYISRVEYHGKVMIFNTIYTSLKNSLKKIEKLMIDHCVTTKGRYRLAEDAHYTPCGIDIDDNE